MKITHCKKIIFAFGLSVVLLVSGCGALGVTYDFSDVDKEYKKLNNTQGMSADSIQKDFDKEYDVDNKAGDISVGTAGFNNSITSGGTSNDSKGSSNSNNSNNNVTKTEYKNAFVMADAKDASDSDVLISFTVLDDTNKDDIVYAYQTLQYSNGTDKKLPDKPYVTSKIVELKKGSTTPDVLWQSTYQLTGSQLTKYTENVKKGIYTTTPTTFFQTVYAKSNGSISIVGYTALDSVTDGKGNTTVTLVRIPKGKKNNINLYNLTDAIGVSFNEAGGGGTSNYKEYEVIGYSVCGDISKDFEINIDVNMLDSSAKDSDLEDAEEDSIAGVSKSFVSRINVVSSVKCDLNNPNTERDKEINLMNELLKTDGYTPQMAFEEAIATYPPLYEDPAITINTQNYFLQEKKNSSYTNYEFTTQSSSKQKITLGDYILYKDENDFLYVLSFDNTFSKTSNKNVDLKKGNDTYEGAVEDFREYKFVCDYMKIQTLSGDGFTDTLQLYDRVCIDYSSKNFNLVNVDVVEHDSFLSGSTSKEITRIDTKPYDDNILIYLEDEENIYLYLYDVKNGKLESLFSDGGVKSVEINLGKPAPEPEAYETEEKEFDIGGDLFSMDELLKSDLYKDALDPDKSWFHLSDYTEGTVAGSTDINSSAKNTNKNNLTPKNESGVVTDILNGLNSELGTEFDTKSTGSANDVNNIISNSNNDNNNTELDEALNQEKDKLTKQNEEKNNKNSSGENSGSNKTEGDNKDSDNEMKQPKEDIYDSKTMNDELDKTDKATESVSSAASSNGEDDEDDEVEELATSQEMLNAGSFILKKVNGITEIYVCTLNNGLLKYNSNKEYIDGSKTKYKCGFDQVNSYSIYMMIGNDYCLGFDDLTGSYIYNDIAEAKIIPKTDFKL